MTPRQARSAIDAALIDEYRHAKYHVREGDQEFVLQIGLPSADLRRLYDAHGVDSAAFITAWNPHGKPAARADNEAANRWLRAELEKLQCVCLQGFGSGTDTTWEPEVSFLALGIGRDPACELGRRYGQNAIVWAGADAVPDLVLLR